jgi:catechol 2,3-dioxygenase-like lactoylglutathione lyase family enzyme
MAIESLSVKPNHVSFTVMNIQRALDVFIQLLGAELLSHNNAANLQGIRGMTALDVKSLEIAFLQLGSQRIELLQFMPMQEATALTPNTPSFAHLAISVADFDTFLAQARQFDLMPIGESMRMLGGLDVGKRAIYLRSPDALVLEVIGV